MERVVVVLDPHRASRILDSSTQRYWRARAPLCEYLIDIRFSPRFAPEFKVLIAESKNDSGVTKAAMETLAAAGEHVIPSNRAVLRSRSTTYVIDYTVPTYAASVVLIAAHMAADGPPPFSPRCTSALR